MIKKLAPFALLLLGSLRAQAAGLQPATSPAGNRYVIEASTIQQRAPLVLKSTSATAGVPIFKLLNNTGTALLTMTQGGTLTVNGTVAATSYTGDGSALTGVGSVGASNTWTKPQYFAADVYITTPTVALRVGTSEYHQGLVDLSGAQMVGGGLWRQTVSTRTCDGWVVQGSAIPDDGTVPQITEGYQILVGTVTPKNAASNLLFLITLVFNEPSNIGNSGALTLFQNSTQSAIHTFPLDAGGNAAVTSQVTLYYEVAAANTTQRNYSLRIGCDVANCLAVNHGDAAGSSPHGAGQYCSEMKIIETEAR